jgi:hypothetical protein
MKRYEWITLVLIVIFGLTGAWVYENVDEWLSNFFAIPPMLYYLVNHVSFVPEKEKKNESRQ